MKRKLTILTLVLAFSLGIFSWAQKASVFAQTRSRSFFDDFDEVLLKPDPKANWWIRNHADNSIMEEQLCGDDSCIQVQQEDGTSFAEFVLFPDQQPGDYTNAEMAELQSGYAYGEEGNWLPNVGQPVILEARVRWRGDFRQDGSGRAVGTSGIWLWNSPLEYATMTFHSPIALGFSWVSDGSSMAQGLNGVVMVQNIPVVVKKPAFDINMGEWVTVKIEWAKDASGQQRVDFWINDQSIGGDTLPIPIDEALSLEVWHDNQAYKLMSIDFEDPVEEQAFQVDYLRVYQK